MQKIFFLAILFLGLSISSNGQNTSDTINHFTTEIPITRNGESDRFYKSTQQKVKELNLDTLQSGFDSLQIRIWYDYGLLNLRKLVIFKRTKSIWTAQLFTMKFNWNQENMDYRVKSNKMETLMPKGSWESFLANFFALQIMTLPNMNDIPGFEDNILDGKSYHVEIATQKQYRFYGYHMPNYFQDKYWQAKNMVEILELIKKEFKIDWNEKR